MTPVLVTGVTGFVGREVARRLLARHRPVWALARARGGVSALARVARAVGCPVDGRRLEVIEGDLAAPDLALHPRARARLLETIPTVIHCAGDTTFEPTDPAAYMAAHVAGPVTLLAALAGGRLRTWIQVSTAYVCGRRTGTILEREAAGDHGFDTTYERAKHQAERALGAAGARLGVDVRVVRPSVVVGAAPATAGGEPSRLIFGIVQAAAVLAGRVTGGRPRLRVPLAADAPFNVVPVGYVVDALLVLSERPAAAGGTFHLAVSAPPTFAEVRRVVAERVGCPGLVLTDPGAGPLADASPLERALGRALAPYRAYLERRVRFDDRDARRHLAREGIAPPTLARDDLHALIDQALATAVPARAPAVARGG
jgi:nucleoside-diphosphate-sugar epimerase